MINNINVVNQINIYQNRSGSEKTDNTQAAPRRPAPPAGDTVTLNQHQPPPPPRTYGIDKASGRIEIDFADLRQLVVDTFKEQGLSTQIAAGDITIDLNKITPEKARELISEDGYFGIEQTSDRIVEMAISLAGNDPGRLDDIKAGIEKGFEQAAEVLGGSLPDISMHTYDAVMEKLDAWAGNVEAT